MMNQRKSLSLATLLIATAGFVGCGEAENVTGAGRPPSDGGNGLPRVTDQAAEPGPASQNAGRQTGIAFRDRTDDSGILFVNRNGEEAGQYSIVESLGGGVGVIDFDRDGRQDVLLPGGGGMSETDPVVPSGLPCGLFRNLKDWQFKDVSEVSGVAIPQHYTHGIACGDFDNDGFSDAVVTGYGGLQFFRNLGDGTFEEATEASGLTDPLWSSSAAWGDITGDGILDLYVCHYVDWGPDNHPLCPGPNKGQREVCPPREFAGLPDTLYTGTPDGILQDKSAASGLRSDGKGLGVLLADLDDDRDLDVYVTNDTVANVLYRNDTDGVLKDVSLVSGASLSARGVPDGSMGVQLLDYDQDGHFDIWVANYERETSALYAGQGELLFRHVSQRTGVTAVGALYVGWGTLCFDADLDGDEDVLVSNGHVIRYPKSAPLRQTPLFFENLGGARFQDVAEFAGEYMSQPHMARGSAAADFDNDGHLDVAVMHTGEPTSLLQNTHDDGHWLIIELTGVESSREAIGTVVEVVVGQQHMLRQCSGGGSYASTSSRCVHFGLGAFDSVDEVSIRWPSGRTQQILDVPANSRIAVVESRDPVVLPQE